MSPTPKNIGPYPVEAEIGRGGMGVVYRGRDPKLDRPVAIKVLPPALAQDVGRVERLRHEARTLAALNHPNILTVHDIDTDEDALYVVMELLEGTTLQERLTTERLDWRRAAEIGAAVADGLAAAHARGIVHRDLKPDNVFLTNDGVVKILDFGLARVEPAADVDTATQTHATQPGTVMGTVGYMSPEQVRGETADARSDIFSFGCVLYEMLTGVVAFKRATSVESMAAILKEQPASPRESVAELPPELERVLSRCLEKSPDDRFQSARDLAFSLRNPTSGPVSGTGSTLSGPQGVTSSPSPNLVPRIAAGVVLSIVVALATWWFLRGDTPVEASGSPPIRAIVVLPFTNESGDEQMDYLGDGIAENVINSLARLDGLRVVPRSSAFRYRGREGDLDVVATDLNVQGVVTGRVTRRGDQLVIGVELIHTASDAQVWGERYDTSVDEILTVESDIAREIVDALRIELTGDQAVQLVKQYTTVPSARMAYMEGRHAWGERSAGGFQRALDLYDRAIAADPNYALAHASKAETYILMAIYTHPPADYAPRAREEVATAIRIDPELAEAYPTQAFVYLLFDWEWEPAKQAFEKAIELNPDYATAHHWYGVGLRMMRETQKSLAEYVKARKLDPGSFIIATDYALSLEGLGRSEEAEVLLADLTETAPTFWRASDTLGDIYFGQGRYEEALRRFENAQEITGGIVWQDGLTAMTLARLGNTDEAREELNRLLSLAKSEYVSPVAIARVYFGLSEMDRCFEWLERAATQRDPLFTLIDFEGIWKEMRRDSRWAELKERVGYPTVD